MFGIGLNELILILIVALIFVGPKKLPEIARTLGKTLAELRRAADDVRHSIDIDNDHNHPEDYYPYQKKPETQPKLEPAKDTDEPKEKEEQDGAHDSQPESPQKS